MSARHVNKTTRDTELIAVTLVRYKETVGKAIEFFGSDDNKVVDIDYERELTKRMKEETKRMQTTSETRKAELEVQKMQIQLEMMRLEKSSVWSSTHDASPSPATPASTPAEPVSVPHLSNELNLVDSWLVHEIEQNTLPQRISSSALRERFNRWAIARDRGHESVDPFAFADFVKGYKNFGMLKKRRSGGQMFFPDLSRLREKFVADEKI